jgi:thiamine-phosphate pyrophosphorylase
MPNITLMTSPLNLNSSLPLTPATAIILRLAPSDERTQINVVKKFAPAFQAQNTAVLVESYAEIALKGGADGVHCTSLKVIKEAMRHHPKLMVGAGGVLSKDEAMEWGEVGVDYLLFHQDPKKSFQHYLEMLNWFTPLFTLPAIGLALNAQQEEPITATGVEFLGRFHA